MMAVACRGEVVCLGYGLVDEEEERTREDKERGSVRFSDRQMRVEASAEEGERCC
jgi:hypothetical protein